MSRVHVFTFALVATIVGCDGSDQKSAEDGSGAAPSIEEPRSFEKAGAEALTRRPYLRGVLPDNTVAYLRVPSPVGFVAGPGGSGFDTAKQAQPHVEAVRAIRGAMDGDEMRSRLGAAAWLVELLVQRIQAPVELALVQRPEAPAMTARALVSTSLDVSGPDAANEFLAKLADQHRMVRLHQPLGADQDAVIGITAAQLRLRWQEDAGRLIGVGGLGTLSSKDLDERLGELAERDSHPMYEAEAEVDSSRRGLFGWIDGNRVRRALSQIPRNRPGTELIRETLQNTRWMAVGWGGKQPVTDDGRRKSRLKFVMSAPREGLRALYPAPENTFDLNAAGDMDWMLAAALPDVETWQTFDERMTNDWLDASQRREYQDAKRGVADYLGFSIEELVGGLGPEVLAFSDDAGRFVATRVQDPSDGPNVARKLLTSKLAAGHETYSYDGTTYHDTRLKRPFIGQWEEQLPESWLRIGRLVNLATGSWAGGFGVKPHLYWLHKGDYVVHAGTPQALLERDRYYAETSVADWVARDQGQDAEHAVLAASVALDGGPRFLYRQYLSLLTHLGDAVGADVDPFAFPSATEAGIPVRGSYGLQVTNAPERFAVELTFEQTPADIATATPYGMVMTMGVLSAIAIPQYQEYVERSRELERRSP